MLPTTRQLALGSLALLLAACSPTHMGQVNVPSNTGDASLVHDGGVVYNNPYGIPSAVGLPLPASVIAAGAGNYRVADLASHPSIAQAIKDNVGVFVNTTKLVNLILTNVAKLGPIPGKSYTFPDDQHPGQQLTILLSVLSDHAVISIGRGTTATGPNQLLAISYTNPKKGQMTFHLENDPTMGHFYLTEAYDLDAGTESAYGVDDTTMLKTNTPQKLNAHWEFTKPANPASGTVAFGMRVAVNVQKSFDPSGSGDIALNANFLADNSAAAIVGLQTAGTNGQFKLVPNDGLSWADPNAGHDFYLSQQGQDMPKAQASTALQAIVPAQSTILSPFPTDPTQGDPFTDSRFDFPATGTATASTGN